MLWKCLSSRLPRVASRWCFGRIGSTACVLAAVVSFAVADDEEAARPRHDELHVRYADARLRLANADLRKFLEFNERHPNAVSANHLTRLRARVRALDAQAEAIRENPHGGAGVGHKARARAAAAIAEAELSDTRRFAAEHPGMVPASTLERLELLAEVARLRVALWEDPANMPSPFDEMQMQVDQLTDLVMDLLDRTDDPILPEAR